MLFHSITNGDIISVLSYIITNLNIIRILAYNDDRGGDRWIAIGLHSPHPRYIITNLQISRCLCRLFVGQSFNNLFFSYPTGLNKLRIKPKIPGLILIRLSHHAHKNAITDIVMISNGTNAHMITTNDHSIIKDIHLNHIPRLLKEINNGNIISYERLTGYTPTVGINVGIRGCLYVPIKYHTDVSFVQFMVEMTISQMKNRLKYVNHELIKLLDRHLNLINDGERLLIDEAREIIMTNINEMELSWEVPKTMIKSQRIQL